MSVVLNTESISNYRPRANSSGFGYEKKSEITKTAYSMMLPSPNNKRNTTYKVVIIGESGVGKSCITLRIAGKKFIEKTTQPTIGAMFLSKEIIDPYTQRKDIFQIWDTAGQEMYRSMMPIYYRNAHIAIIVYSVTCRMSYNKVHEWAVSISLSAKINDGMDVIVLVGNKTDLTDRRVIGFDEGLLLQKKLEVIFPNSVVLFCETSAKDDNDNDKILHLALNEFKKDSTLSPEFNKKSSKQIINLEYDPIVSNVSVTFNKYINGTNNSESEYFVSNNEKRRGCC